MINNSSRLLHRNLFKNGDWGLGIGDWAQSPIPNPQSPIPNPQTYSYRIKSCQYKYLTEVVFSINPYLYNIANK